MKTETTRSAMKRQLSWNDFIWVKTAPFSQQDKAWILGLNYSYIHNLIIGRTRADWQKVYKRVTQAEINKAMESYIPRTIDTGLRRKPRIKDRLEIRDFIFILRSRESIDKIMKRLNIKRRFVSDVITGRIGYNQVDIIQKMSKDERDRLMTDYTLTPLENVDNSETEKKVRATKLPVKPLSEIIRINHACFAFKNMANFYQGANHV